MKKKEGFALRAVGGEQLLVAEGLGNVDFGHIIAFNDTAAYLWEKLGDAEFDVAKMADALVEEYEVDRATVLADAEELVRAWREAGIITG